MIKNNTMLKIANFTSYRWLAYWWPAEYVYLSEVHKVFVKIVNMYLSRLQMFFVQIAKTLHWSLSRWQAVWLLATENLKAGSQAVFVW